MFTTFEKKSFVLLEIEQAEIMRNYKHKKGFTLVEILIVVGIIAILTSMVIGIASRFDNQGKERLVKETFAILATALEQFRDYGYRYPDGHYAELNFPLDCGDISEPELKKALGTDLDVDNYTGSELWCLFLSRVPESRQTLARIDESLKGRTSIEIGGVGHSFVKIIDPWGSPVRYSYFYEPLRPDDKWTFPVIESAGPDKEFGTRDDISSK